MKNHVKNSVENYLWKPSLSRQASSRLAAFSAEYWAGHAPILIRAGYDTLYDNLWQWSVNNRADFWRGVWQFCSVQGEMGGRILTDESDIKNARFFPDARLNYAQNLLARVGRPSRPYQLCRGRHSRCFILAGIARTGEPIATGVNKRGREKGRQSRRDFAQ